MQERYQSHLSRFCVHSSSAHLTPACLIVMPTKGPGELTGDEVKVLKIASKLLFALCTWADGPPPQTKWAFWNKKMEEEVVRPTLSSIIYV